MYIKCFFNLICLFSSGLNGERGFGIAVLWYASSETQVQDNTSTSQRLIHTKNVPCKDTFTYTFSDVATRSLAISGGKGASLALLRSVNQEPGIQFNVPNGFVISVSALDLQLRRNPDLIRAINDIKKIAFGTIEGSVEEACSR